MKKLFQVFIVLLTALTCNIYASGYSITNNYQTNITNCQLYYGSSQYANIGTINGNSSSQNFQYSGMYALQGNDLGATLIFPINSNANTNLFGYGSIYNNSTSTIYLYYYGTINYPSGTQTNVGLIFSNPIALAPGSSVPIITNTTKIIGCSNSNSSSSSNTLFTINPASANAAYFIAPDYSISNTTFLTNNFNNQTSTINFSNSSGTLISSTSVLNAWSNIAIPDNTYYIQAFGLMYNGAVTIIMSPDITPTSIYTDQIITNNSSYAQLYIQTYLSNYADNQTVASGGFLLNQNESLLVPTGTTFVQIYTANQSTILISQSAISTNQSYSITNNGEWLLTAYQPTITNNGTTSASSINFYNSNNQLLSPSNGSLAAQANMSTFGNYSYMTMNNNDFNSQLTLPIIFGYENFFTGQTLFNNTGATVNITYYGTINNVTNYQLNATSVTLTNGQSLAIPSGALNVSITSSAGKTPLNQASITANTSYFIYDNSGSLAIETYPSGGSINNNYTTSISNLYFYTQANNASQGAQPINLTAQTMTAGGANAIPSTSNSMQFLQTINAVDTNNAIVASTPTNININIQGSASSNIFYASEALTNNSPYPISIIYWNSLNAQLNTSAISVPTNCSIPILTNITYLQVIYNGVVVTTADSIAGQNNYFVNYLTETQTWVVDSFPAEYTLSNSGYNSVQTLTNLNFYPNTPVTPINPTPLTLNAGQTTAIPSTAFYATGSTTINGTTTNITVPVYTSASSTLYGITDNSTIFASGSITNNSAGTLSVTYSGIIESNNVIAVIPLNSTPILVYPNESIPIITGCGQVAITSSSGSTSINQSIGATTNYYVNDSGSALGLNQGLLLLTNNYSQSTGTLTFNDSATTTLPSLASWSSTSIPVSATTATFSQEFNNQTATLTIPVSSFTASNIFENYCLYNNYSAPINVTFYGTVNNTANTAMNTTPMTLQPGQSVPIFNNTTAIAISSTPHSYPLTALGSTTTSYQVVDGSSALTVQPYTPTLTNNYQNATNVAFLQSNNAQISSTIPTFNSNQTASVSALATSASMHDLGVTLSLPVTLDPTSNLFTSNTLTNTTNQTVGICFAGTINNNVTYFNTTTIALGAFDTMQIPTGATSIAFVQTGNTSPIGSTPLATNQSYFILQNANTQDWSISTTVPLSTANFINNTTPSQTALNLEFFNQNNFLLASYGSLSTTSGSNSVAIPQSANYATAQQTFNGVNTTLTVPVIDTSSSNIYEPYVIYNDYTQTMYVNFYGTYLGGVSPYLLNSNPIPVLANSSLQIITGAQFVSITANNLTQSPQIAISSNSSYYVTYTGSQWTLLPYSPNPAPIATITNNYSATATNLAFFDTNNVQINTTIPSFPSNTPLDVPINCMYATTTILSSAITISAPGNANTNLFSQNVINNNSASLAANVIFYGTVNGVANTQLNNPAISIPAGQPIPIITGATSLFLVQNSTTYTIAPNTSYYLNDTNSIWTFNSYASNALLKNNEQTTLNNLIFNNATNSAPSVPQTVNANSSIAIPSNSTTATFTDFNTTITIPVSSTSSSSVFSNSVLTNNTNQTIGIVFYGTINGVANQPCNASPGIQLSPNESINILTNTTSLQVYNSSTMVINTISYSNPLPLNVSYDITYISSIWAIAPTILSFMNNSNEYVTNISYYDATNTVIPFSYTTIFPWATIPIPANATSAIVVYPSGTITVGLSTQYSSKALTNSLLINNSDQNVTITFSGQVQGSTMQLNDTSIILLAGQSIPFITGTTNISIQADDLIITTNASINTAYSYEISSSINSTRNINQHRSEQLRAASSDPVQSSSALGVMRFLGGSTPTDPQMQEIYLYAQNPRLFKQYLYIDLYAQIITDPAALAATKTSVNVIIDNYALNYRNQPNFNYISYFYLIGDQLTAAQLNLTTQYPNSTRSINKFFNYINKRITKLLQ